MALNCVANGKVLRDGRFEKIWIQPAAGDAGGALGAALCGLLPACRQAAGSSRNMRDGMHGAYLGPSFAQEDIERRLEAAGARFETVLARPT